LDPERTIEHGIEIQNRRLLCDERPEARWDGESRSWRGDKGRGHELLCEQVVLPKRDEPFRDGPLKKALQAEVERVEVAEPSGGRDLGAKPLLQAQLVDIVDLLVVCRAEVEEGEPNGLGGGDSLSGGVGSEK